MFDKKEHWEASMTIDLLIFLFQEDLITLRLILQCSSPVNCGTLILQFILNYHVDEAWKVRIPFISS